MHPHLYDVSKQLGRLSQFHIHLNGARAIVVVLLASFKHSAIAMKYIGSMTRSTIKCFLKVCQTVCIVSANVG